MSNQAPQGPITVAIIGAGVLGRRLALASVRAGFRVFLEDVMPKELKHAQEELRRQLGDELIHEDGGRVSFVGTIDEAVREADLAIDCVPDELESKLEILLLLDRMCPPRTVLATPILAQAIADLSSCTYRPERCVAILSKPANLAVEASGKIDLLPSPQCLPEALELVHAYWRKLGYAVEVKQSA
jgi:3-hydroxybutyryl-CoA dehydrogenase